MNRSAFFLNQTLAGLSLLVAAVSIPANAAEYTANPGNYRSLIDSLVAGDTLRLEAGNYSEGMTLRNLHGSAGNPIIITGPQDGSPATILGRSCCNSVQLENSSYLEVRNLTLDGQNIAYIDGVNARGTTHHITVEGLSIINHGGSAGPDSDHQLTVGISTKGPAWDWVIRNNTVIGAGTGVYLGNSNGNEPFVRGVIEHNLFMNTLGYNMQIKHQNSRPTGIGLPTGDSRTIIRHNTFIKAANGSVSGAWARPNLLLGHFPTSGSGSNDLYEVYGNFFYQNPSDALFQGEGNLALYDNLFVNNSGNAINIQGHNDVPRSVSVFHNTVVASGRALRVADVHSGYTQRVLANALFAATPVSLSGGVISQDNVTDSYGSSVNYLVNPGGSLGEIDLFPLENTLSGATVDMLALQQFDDWDLDFNGAVRSGGYRGAYAAAGVNPGWIPDAAIKPARDALPEPEPEPVPPEPEPVPPEPEPEPEPVPPEPEPEPQPVPPEPEPVPPEPEPEPEPVPPEPAPEPEPEPVPPGPAPEPEPVPTEPAPEPAPTPQVQPVDNEAVAGAGEGDASGGGGALGPVFLALLLLPVVWQRRILRSKGITGSGSPATPSAG